MAVKILITGIRVEATVGDRVMLFHVDDYKAACRLVRSRHTERLRQAYVDARAIAILENSGMEQ